jgi:hypothetical protein
MESIRRVFPLFYEVAFYSDAKISSQILGISLQRWFSGFMISFFLQSTLRDLRNKYSHFNIQEITKGAVFARVKEKNVETGEEKIVELPASTSPTLQIIAKDRIDEDNVMKVFQFADRIVQYLFATPARS